MPISSTEPSMQCSPFFEEVEGLKEVADARVSEREGVSDDGEWIEYQSTDFLRTKRTLLKIPPPFYSLFLVNLFFLGVLQDWGVLVGMRC